MEHADYVSCCRLCLSSHKKRQVVLPLPTMSAAETKGLEQLRSNISKAAGVVQSNVVRTAR